MVEQAHRNIKSRTNVMLGFRCFRNAATAGAIIAQTQAMLRQLLQRMCDGSRMVVREDAGSLWRSLTKIIPTTNGVEP